MPTSRWRSSLNNIETKLRRGLGIAGPVDLDLGERPILTPVVIVEDLTRAGYASQLRGRRWMTAVQPAGTIAAGAQGSVWLLADSPAISTGTGARVDTFSGGVQIDQLELDVSSAGAQAIDISMWFWATPTIIAPGLPVGGFANFAAMVDPQRTAFEVAPLQQTSSQVIAGNAGGGFLFWRRRFNSLLNHNITIPLNIFLNYNSAISLGNSDLGSSVTTLRTSWSGRIF